MRERKKKEENEAECRLQMKRTALWVSLKTATSQWVSKCSRCANTAKER